MRDENKEIVVSWTDAIEILKEINLVLISLHKMGSYYGEKFLLDNVKYRKEYEEETTRFIDEWNITHRLSKVRSILDEKFDDTIGFDDMDDVERALEFLESDYWEKPGDMPSDKMKISKRL